MSDIMRSVWTYTVNGNGFMGTYTEDYCRGMYESTLRINPNAAVQVIRIDHVASDFATTGVHWTSTRTVVLDSKPQRSLADVIYDVATLVSESGTATVNSVAFRIDALFHLAQEQKCHSEVRWALIKLTEAEPERLPKLVESLALGRTQDVLNALRRY